jgi:enoyl-CoA hydratase/carnithine racemase
MAGADGEVRTEVADSVGHIWLTRPGKRNALNHRSFESLTRTLVAWREDPAVRAVTLSGEGESFCSGADLDDFHRMLDADALAQRGFQTLMEDLIVAFRRLGKPCVAGVQGVAFAGGMALVLLSDLVIAAEDAKFGLPEIKVGIWPLAVSVLLSRAVGTRRAMELMLSGDPFDAHRAETLGIVTRVVPAPELTQAVGDIARKLARQSASAMRIGHDTLMAIDSMTIGEAMALMREATVPLFQNPDAREGITAFLERRKPRWT